MLYEQFYTCKKMKLVITKQLINKWIFYLIWWWTAALVDLFFLYIFTEYIWFHYLLSSVFSFSIAFVYGFSFQKYITFKQHTWSIQKQAWLFFVFQIIWLWINAFLLRIFVDHLRVYYLYAAVFNKWVIFLRNFFMNYFYNFRQN